ncbi:MAG: Rcs stress response system protein RcsF [Succinivibrionaceae bacterium]
MLYKKLFLFWLLISIGIVGCSSFSFETNLNQQKFSEYFNVANIQVYNNAELHELNYIDIGTVEGISCQVKPDDPRASYPEARQEARKKAAEMEANGIVYSTCIELENTLGCESSVSCYARAIYVKDNN